MHCWLPDLHSMFGKNTLGYLASMLVLCTFSVRSMRLLRGLGIASNVSFLSYALLVGLPPIAILHALLLPINIFRLIQLERERIACAVDDEWVPNGSGRAGRASELYAWSRDWLRRARERGELRSLDYRERHDIEFTPVLGETAKKHLAGMSCRKHPPIPPTVG